MAAENGAVTPQLIETNVALAQGGVGLIVSGHTYVSREGQAGPRQLGVYSDDLVAGLRQLTGAVRDAGGKMVLQLAHAGNFAAVELTGRPPLVVSDVESLGAAPRMELTAEDIQALVAAYASAARRAKSAGFDGVQIHSAHGYLLSQFLSPLFNHRRDAYGGAITNRVRVHLQIIRAIRDVVGGRYPLLTKINCSDFQENGLTPEDALAAVRLMAGAGLDAVELSGGLLTARKTSPSRIGINSEDKEAYFRQEARAFKHELGIPLILIGGIRSFGVAERLVADATADYVAMSRPLIREPGLIKRWKEGDRRPAACKSDNQCFGPALKGEGIRCVTAAREQQA
jgi:2,4-dienoyl-CoA reductase-like NADH-dependent reductase (Old Yellow Enzyme family)